MGDGREIWKVKWPCGLEINFRAEFEGALIMGLHWNFAKEIKRLTCPLHGEDCSNLFRKVSQGDNNSTDTEDDNNEKN